MLLDGGVFLRFPEEGLITMRNILVAYDGGQPEATGC